MAKRSLSGTPQRPSRAPADGVIRRPRSQRQIEQDTILQKLGRAAETEEVDGAGLEEEEERYSLPGAEELEQELDGMGEEPQPMTRAPESNKQLTQRLFRGPQGPEPEPEPEPEAPAAVPVGAQTGGYQRSRREGGPAAQPGVRHDLALSAPLPGHGDHMWDWIRQDQDRGKHFLGTAPATFHEMEDALVGFGPGLHSLMMGNQHIGFVGLQPLVSGKRYQLHLYLSQGYRNQLESLVPSLQMLASQQLPGVTFVVATTHEADARLWSRFGLKLTYVLEWATRTV